jgi:acyl-CoA thioesterase-1
MSVWRASFAALVAVWMSLAAAPAGAADPCDAPADLAGAVEPLRHVARAAATRKALRVLVVGSASTTIGGTSAPQAAYPGMLEAELGRQLLGIGITLQTRGGRGMTANDLGKVLEHALPEFRPDLVIWQTGTVDAVNALDRDEFERVLRAGSERVTAAGADLILIDQQFNRAARATINYAPYRQAMEAVANASDAMLLRRYDLMRHWAETGQIDLERAPRRDWQRTADQLHACLGKVLAQLIVQGMREAKR